jgi:hypothetical protein
VLVRAPLAVLAVLVMAGLATFLRSELVGRAAGDRIFYTPDLSRRELDHELARLKSAGERSPLQEWNVARARLLILRHRPQEAARVAGAVVRAEPANVAAWVLLERATRRSDPLLAAEAQARIRELSPLASREAARRPR